MFRPVDFPEFYVVENPTSADKSFSQTFAHAQADVEPIDIEDLYHELEKKLKPGRDGDFGLIFMDSLQRHHVFGPKNLSFYGGRNVDLEQIIVKAFHDGFYSAQNHLKAEVYFIGGVIRADGWLRRLMLDEQNHLSVGENYR